MKVFILLLLFTLPAFADESGRVSAVIRVERKGNEFHVIKLDDNQLIPTVFQNERIRQEFDALASEEAIIHGHITYQRSHADSSHFDPWFVVEEIRPVSLSSLRIPSEKIEDPDLNFTITPNWSPSTLPITTEVASAITLTGALLLMNSLTMSPETDPEERRIVRNGLFLSAGTMATLLFLYNQATGKTKP